MENVTLHVDNCQQLQLCNRLLVIVVDGPLQGKISYSIIILSLHTVAICPIPVSAFSPT